MSNSANGTELGCEVEEAGPNLAGQHIATALGHDVDGVGGSGSHIGGPMHDDAHGCGGVGAQSRLQVLLTCWCLPRASWKSWTSAGSCRR